MKKIILAFEGTHFSEGVFEFVNGVAYMKAELDVTTEEYESKMELINKIFPGLRRHVYNAK